jgi:hypothetical protein
MYKSKKVTALFLALIMMFSLALNPLLVVSANVPIKPPAIPAPGSTKTEDKAIPNPKAPIIPQTPKTPSITAPSTVQKMLEQPAKVQGVNYEIKDNVKRLPAGMSYDLGPLTLDKFVTFEVESQVPKLNPNINLPNVQAPNQGTQNVSGEPLDKINGIKYPAGSKLLTIPKSFAATFTPSTGEIYIDEEEGNAFKILGYEGQDSQENELYSVETPELLDVFKSYNIPKQTLNLTTGNIAYIDPDFELSPESGMPKNYVAKADGTTVFENDYITCSIEGNKHILKLKEKILFQYPSKEQVEESERAKKEAKEEKFKGDWWDKEQYSDLRGVEDESAFSVAIKVKEGSTITIEDPKFHAYFDINWITSQLDAGFYFDAKAKADVTLLGDLTFNYTLEKCVYGYDIDLGKTMGKEKGNKAFVGIFLVLGINGEIHVEVRTITTGDAKAGFTYKSIGYGSLPYYVGPIQEYRPSSFDMSFTVDGEVHATLACVPQVGVIIWGCELGVLQIWVGFKSTARFHFEGGGGTDTDASLSGNGSINLRAFGELVGYLIGKRYSIFYIEFPIYSGEWKIGEEVSGSGGDMVKRVPPFVKVDADAHTNKVEGNVAFCTAEKNEIGYLGDDEAALDIYQPYYNSLIALEVYDKDMNFKFSKALRTDYDGKFTEQFTGVSNILPSDKIFVNIQEHMSPDFTLENGKKFKVVGKSLAIKPTVPFTLMDFDVDTFNDVVSGWVSGDYTGPINISIDKFIDGNNKVTDIKTANVEGGLFKLNYPIDQSTDWVSIYIDFEGSRFSAGPKLRNLDALIINAFNDYTTTSATSSSSPKTGGSLMAMAPTLPTAPVSDQSGGIPSITLPGGVIPPKPDKGVTIGESTQKALDRMMNHDVAGNKIIIPTKITGNIINRGSMGWAVKQGDSYVLPEEENQNLNYFNGNVKIKEIYVQTALAAMWEKYFAKKIPGLGTPKPNFVPYIDTTQTRQEIGYKKVIDSSNPLGFTMQSYPTSTAKFVFDNPSVAAYEIEIEYEGLTVKHIYNPFEYHYEGSGEQRMEDFIGPLRQAYQLRTQERIESVINPADNMRDNINIDKQQQMH